MFKRGRFAVKSIFPTPIFLLLSIVLLKAFTMRFCLIGFECFTEAYPSPSEGLVMACLGFPPLYYHRSCLTCCLCSFILFMTSFILLIDTI